MADEPIEYHHYRLKTDGQGNPIELGRGDLGVTYRAIDTNEDDEVVLRVINPKVLGDDDFNQRFILEARAAVAMRHPNIASVLHFGEAHGTYYYAMETVHGETLAARVRRKGSLVIGEALTITEQVACALIAAEEKNVVHRDIKPSNIIIAQREDGEQYVKLIDFGLVKNLQPESAQATWKSMAGFVGTPAFSSPEQFQGIPLDARSDIYSLGVTLWYALTGHLPFRGSVDEVMLSHLQASLPLEQLKHLPSDLQATLVRMLEKNARDRPANATILHREIESNLRAIPAQSYQQPNKKSEAKKLTREEKEQLFADAVKKAEQEAEARRQAEEKQKREEELEREKKNRLEEERLDRDRAEKEKLLKEKAEKKRREEEAEVAELKRIREEKAAEKERIQKENESLELEAKARAEKEAEVRRQAEKLKKQEEELERKEKKCLEQERDREKAEKERLKKEEAEKERLLQEAQKRAELELKKREEHERQKALRLLAIEQEEAKKEKRADKVFGRHKHKDITASQSWRPVRTRKSRRPLVIAAIFSITVVAGIALLPKSNPPPSGPDYLAESVSAWKAGDYQAAHENLDKLMKQNPGMENPGSEFRTLLKEAVIAVEAGDLGPMIDAAKHWENMINLARKLKVEGISEALASIDRVQLYANAVALWEQGDRKGAAQALADYHRDNPDLESLSPAIIDLVKKIVDTLLVEAPGEIGGEWEPVLTMAASRDDSAEILLLLANSIYARDPAEAFPFYKDLLMGEPRGEPPARIKFCLRLLSLYPGSEGELFREELKNEFSIFFSGGQTNSTGELLRRIPMEDWTRSAEYGVAEAMLRLGHIYSSKELNSIERNDVLALKWFEKAADAGLLQAKFSVALMNINGRGIETTPEKAMAKGFAMLEDSTEAERKAEPLFVNQLGICYEKGLGTVPDPEKAKHYYDIALNLCRGKYEQKDLPLSYFWRYAILLQKNNEWEKVGEILREGVSRNDLMSQLMLGILHDDEVLDPKIREISGVEYDSEKGKKLIVDAAKAGFPMAVDVCRKKGWSFK